ncbi:MAG: amino acid adenylation domain-containing protein [Myxacorys californica WJT36-NPBG1]|jgi:amino acid adenylation domain-containing protein|nr:amino acid adenylation domain-containing protein [Myxacorys californica WJT36-NPBG1]
MGNRNLEDFYPLSPTQQGILFHTLCAPRSGMYYEQLSCTLNGKLDTKLFQQAWQALCDRHPILRTAFVWEGIKEPVQVVHRQVKLPWRELDWQAFSPREQQEQLEHFLKTDQEQGFDLTQAPLMRFALIRLDQQSYRFVWSHHHILLDGWSTPLLLKEVFADYQALCQGQSSSLPRPRPYRDYIAWIQQQDLSKARAFWQQRLQGFSTPTTIEQVLLKKVATDPDAADAQVSYDEQHIQLLTAKTRALQSFARQHQLTLNTLVQGAWALLLSRYSSEDDVVFGAAVSGRPPTLAGSEAMVGLFINTLPVRVQVQAAENLLPWLQQLQAQQVEARQYEYSPLVEVQGWSDVPRGLPLFESVVVFENYPINAALQTQTDLEIRDIRAFEKTNYPLTLIAFPGSELGLKVLYDSQRFASAAIARMLGHLQTLLEGMISHPNQCLSGLPILTEAEQHQLAEWNNTQVEYPNQCVHQRFEAQVERTPDAVALVYGDEQFTYRELNQRSNQLAHYLQTLGVTSEVLVGVCLERSPEMVMALLGILKAGGAYVPLDPAYPQERLSFMMNDAQMAVLLTRSYLADTLPEHSAKLVCLDTDWDKIRQASQQNLTENITADQLAYVLYTSGSTGTPKGAMGLHRGTVNRLHWNPYPFTSDDVCCQKTSLNFVDSVWEIFAPLLHGLRSVILPDSAVKDPLQFVQMLAEQQVTRLVLVPSLLRVLLETIPDLHDRLPKLKYWVSSGEALTIELCQRFRQQVPHCILINLYGSSEVAADVTWHDTSINHLSDFIPIGRAIANTQIYILDRHLQPVPIGVPGELHIAGAGLARGYWNRPELTAEKFISNPFQIQKEQSRLYKTGDLGCFLPDGEIKFLGRSDHQVKLRGIRIETREIESWIDQHPSVQESVVIAWEDSPGNSHLIAYVVPRLEQQQSVEPLNDVLRNFLSEKLPEYMVPISFILLEALPLTPNGKIDRRALPAPETHQRASTNSFVPPQTPIEVELANIWATVLGLEQVSIEDNFFNLGGHSLLAMQLISRVCKQFEVELSLPDFFAAATIRELAETIEDAILAQSNPADLDRLLDQLEATDETATAQSILTS